MGIVRSGDWTEANAEEIAKKADAVVLAVGFDPATETEGADRTFRLPPGQDELIRKIAALNRKTIVVVTSGGGVDTSSWLPQVLGLIEAWYPGQEGGTALAEILFGDVNPSGHLPITFERRWEDNPTHDNYNPEPGTNRIVYKEGIFTGYRGYEKNHTQPLFPFGYGLSYTTFRYSHLEITPVTPAQPSDAPQYGVSFQVENTGKRAGAGVAQVYVTASEPLAPWPKQLKGSARVGLQPGESRSVTVPLDRRAFTYYDVNAKQWAVDGSAFDISVGTSSAQSVLNERIKRQGPQPGGRASIGSEGEVP